MLKSIRARLTAWYVGVLLIILGICAALVYGMMARSLHARLDRELASAARVLASSLAEEIDENNGEEEGEVMFRDLLTTVHRTTFQDYAIAVYQGNHLVGRKPAETGEDPLPRVAPGRLPPGGAVYTTRAGWRMIAMSAHIQPAWEDYTFLLAEREADAMEQLVWLSHGIELTIPLSLALAALGGWWMARKSLSPVVDMSKTVDNIGASNLGQRIHAPNPEDELGLLGATFNRLLDRLERAFEQQRQFMADAAHELRTPVSIARTAAQLALGPPRDGADYRDLLETIEGQMRRLSGLVQDMFLLSRADAGPLPLHAELLYLDELIAEVVHDAAVLARKREIRLSTSGLRETALRGDDALLRRLLLVLLDNALQHTPAGGEIAVTLESYADFCRILVRDTGSGIPADDVPRIFERFYRAEKSRVRSNGENSGAGLGLAIGRSIAEAHGGTLELDSTGPGGTTFRVTLSCDASVPASSRSAII